MLDRVWSLLKFGVSKAAQSSVVPLVRLVSVVASLGRIDCM